MSRPAFSIWLIAPQTVQCAAGIRLESVHDWLGTTLRLHDYVNVIGPYVCGQETPATMQTNLAQSGENGRPAILIEAVGRLVHLLEFCRYTLLTGFR